VQSISSIDSFPPSLKGWPRTKGAIVPWTWFATEARLLLVRTLLSLQKLKLFSLSSHRHYRSYKQDLAVRPSRIGTHRPGIKRSRIKGSGPSASSPLKRHLSTKSHRVSILLYIPHGSMGATTCHSPADEGCQFFMTRIERLSRVSRDRRYVGRGFIPVWERSMSTNSHRFGASTPKWGDMLHPQILFQGPLREEHGNRPSVGRHSWKISYLFQPPMKQEITLLQPQPVRNSNSSPLTQNG
jgi:hypothetical protein